jgi:hypothetical protein
MNLNLDEHKEGLERMLNSQGYSEFERSFSQSNPAFDNLPKKAKDVSLYLFSIDRLDVLENLWSLFFRTKPLSFDKFRETFGAEGRSMYLPWRKVLNELFEEKSNYKELILTGSTGSGKSFCGRMATIYAIYRILCLKQPQLSLGISPASSIIARLLTLNLEKAVSALYEPHLSLLRFSSLFTEVKKREELVEYENDSSIKVIPFIDQRMSSVSGAFRKCQFPYSVYLEYGSQLQHVISSDSPIISLDESEWRVNSVDSVLELFAEMKSRSENRFGKSRFTLIQLISSSRSNIGVISRYIKKLEPEDFKHVKIAGFPIWEAKVGEDTPDPYERGHFYVLRGVQNNPSRFLTDIEKENQDNNTFQVPVGCEVIKVPIEYERTFRTDLEKALRDVGGEISVSDDKPFQIFEGMEYDFLTPEFNLIADLTEEGRLLDKLPINLFKRYVDGKLRFKRYPHAMRYCHIDLAESDTSEAGISIVHKEIEDGNVVIVSDLTAYITAPNRIYIQLIINLLYDLVRERGVVFRNLSFDQYQSTAARQSLEKDKISEEVSLLSVDRDDIPYRSLSNIINKGRFKIGTCTKLKTQLESLSIHEGKVIKPKESRKDEADAVCGAVFNALQYTRDVPVDPFIPSLLEIQEGNYGDYLKGKEKIL